MSGDLLYPILLFLFIGALVGIPAFRAYHAQPRKSSHVCNHCRSVVTPVQRMPGSTAITVLLTLLGIIPGLIYAIWRSSAKRSICPVCQAENPIPLGTPAASALMG